MKCMPSVFVGHGNPMNALAENRYTRGWSKLGRALPRPRAILAISAHWYGSRHAVTCGVNPPIIHDFSGFPDALFDVRYPAPGSPELARRVVELLAPVAPVDMDAQRGLDHGSWAVLCHIYPQADIPVIQLSIDASMTPAAHYGIGQRLSMLRDEDILVLGSGNIVHNLRTYAWSQEQCPPYDWAQRFEQTVRRAIDGNLAALLVDYPLLGEDARRSVPTPEHFLPLLYVLGMRLTEDRISYPVEGMDGGSISMLAVQVG